MFCYPNHAESSCNRVNELREGRHARDSVVMVIVFGTAKVCDYLALHGNGWLWRAERVEPHTLRSFFPFRLMSL